MWSRLRPVLAILAGALVSIVLAYLGAVVWLLATMGIPLGATPREPTGSEYGALILIAGVAAAVGGRVSARIAARHRRPVVLLLAAGLSLMMLWGFSGAVSHWPRWWAPAIALTFAAGVSVGGLARRATPGRMV